MYEPPALFSRRHLARSTFLGGASVLLAPALHAQSVPPSLELFDPHNFGAKGDGHHDDTTALQAAIDASAEKSSAVFIPPGVYLTSELHLHPGMALTGVPAWNYRAGVGGSVLRLASANAQCLLNLTDARGATIHGLALDGGNLGHGVHGMAVLRNDYPRENAFRIDTCQAARFTGSGMFLSRVWCFSVRHCEVIDNHGDGLTLRGWDAFILDNWLSGNGRAGFAARDENASVTFTANRVEWNGEENMVVTGGDGYQITGNFFDRAGTVGIALRRNPQSESWNKGPCTQFSITGNLIKRSGRNAAADSPDSAQVVLDSSTGVTFTGNTLWAGRDDGNQGVWSPSNGIVVVNPENCVIANNVLHDGALRHLIVDNGDHPDGLVLRDNPGRLLVPQQDH